MDDLVQVFDTGSDLSEFAVQTGEFVVLVGGLARQLVAALGGASDLTARSGSVVLNGLNFSVKCREPGTVLINLDLFAVGFLSQLVGLHALVAKQVLRLGEVLADSLVAAVLLIGQASQLFELLLAVADLFALLVDVEAGLALVSGFVVGQHAVAILCVEYVVLSGTHVTVVVGAQLAELVTKLADLAITVVVARAGHAGDGGTRGADHWGRAVSYG